MKKLFSILIIFCIVCLAFFSSFAEPNDIKELSIIKSGGKAGEYYSLKMYLAEDKALIEKSELEFEGASSKESSFVLDKAAFSSTVDFINSNAIRKFASLPMDAMLEGYEISTTTIILKLESGFEEKINELQLPISEDFRGFLGLKPFIEKQIAEKQIKGLAVHNGKPVKIDESQKSPDGKGFLIASEKAWYADMLGEYAMFEEDLYSDEASLNIELPQDDEKKELAALSLAGDGKISLRLANLQINARLPEKIYTNSPISFNGDNGEKLEILTLGANSLSSRFLLKIELNGKTNRLIFTKVK